MKKLAYLPGSLACAPKGASLHPLNEDRRSLAPGDVCLVLAHRDSLLVFGEGSDFFVMSGVGFGWVWGRWLHEVDP